MPNVANVLSYLASLASTGLSILLYNNPQNYENIVCTVTKKVTASQFQTFNCWYKFCTHSYENNDGSVTQITANPFKHLRLSTFCIHSYANIVYFVARKINAA